MGGELIALQVLILLFALVLLGVAIFAVLRTSGLRQLSERLHEVERELRRLRRERQQPAVEEAELLEPIPVEEPESGAPLPPRQRQPLPPPAGSDASRIEGVIGQKILGWAAVVLLLFAVGFFIKYAFDNDWIGPVGQIATGAVLGSGLCVAGLRAHQRQRFLASQMLTAGGVIILYLSVFATFGFYDLIPRDRAAVYLTLVVAMSALLAVLYNARAIASMALLGGLLAPILLASNRDQYVSLFVFLIALTAGTLTMSYVRRWLFLAVAALLGVQAMFWLWFGNNYHPEKQTAALDFQCVLFALFLLHDALVPAVLRRRADPLQLVGLVLNAFLFAFAGAVMLWDEPTALLAALAVGLAVLYTVVTWLVRSRTSDDTPLSLTAIAVALAFLATAIGFRGHAGWIALGWAVEGLALWWFGLRIRAIPLRLMGGVLLLLALFRYLVADIPWRGLTSAWPLFNSDTLPGLAIAACLLTAGWLVSRSTMQEAADKVFRAGTSLGGVLLLWLVLSLEVYHFASTRWPDQTESFSEGLNRAHASLSVFWALFAGAVMAGGFLRKLRPLRVLALCLFGLTTVKVILIDMGSLPGLYRVAAFFVLAVVLGGAAYAYQRFEAALRPIQEIPHVQA